MKATYTVVLERELDGRTIASVPGVAGCHAYGRTPQSAIRRVRSALRFYLSELARSGSPLPSQLKPVVTRISIAV